MSRVQVLYSRRHAISTPILRAAAWSHWSHVAIIADDHVIEAVAFDGVRRISMGHALSIASAYHLDWLPCANPEVAIAAAESQIGKPYDWLGVAGIGLRRDWQNMDAWFCSELVAWAIGEGGTPLFRADRMRRVTQEHLYMLAPAARV